MHHHQGRLPPGGDHRQGHDRLAGTGRSCQSPEVAAQYGLYRLHLEVFQPAGELEIHRGEPPGLVVNLAWHSRVPKQPEGRADESPRHDQAIRTDMIEPKFLRNPPVGKSPLLVLHPDRVRKTQPILQPVRYRRRQLPQGDKVSRWSMVRVIKPCSPFMMLVFLPRQHQSINRIIGVGGFGGAHFLSVGPGEIAVVFFQQPVIVPPAHASSYGRGVRSILFFLIQLTRVGTLILYRRA